MIFAALAVLIWQLSDLSRADPRLARPLLLTILACEILLSAMSWIYFFAGPGVMSLLIVLCLGMALLMLSRLHQPAIAKERKIYAT